MLVRGESNCRVVLSSLRNRVRPTKSDSGFHSSEFSRNFRLSSPLTSHNRDPSYLMLLPQSQRERKASLLSFGLSGLVLMCHQAVL